MRHDVFLHKTLSTSSKPSVCRDSVHINGADHIRRSNRSYVASISEFVAAQCLGHSFKLRNVA